MYIYFLKQEGIYSKGTTDVTGTVTSSIFAIGADVWYDVQLIYNGENFTFKINGLVVQVVPATGKIEIGA